MNEFKPLPKIGRYSVSAKIKDHGEKFNHLAITGEIHNDSGEFVHSLSSICEKQWKNRSVFELWLEICGHVFKLEEEKGKC